MKWGFTLPGQPPTVNKTYKPAKRYGRRGAYIGLVKDPSVTEYQAKAVPVIRSAKPSRWAPTGQIRVLYDFYLSRAADGDNLQKALNDAIQTAIGINDERFLPCVQSKQIVSPKEARVEVIIEDLE